MQDKSETVTQMMLNKIMVEDCIVKQPVKWLTTTLRLRETESKESS